MDNTVERGRTVRIDPRFRGPDDSGNGGYVCGLVAQFVDGGAEVTLRTPPPLDRPLEVRCHEDGSVALRDGDTLVAEASPLAGQIEPPPPVKVDTATRAVPSPEALEAHVFPNCFVCGPARTDGLRIFPGMVGDGLLAAPWTPGTDALEAGGQVAAEFVWAALDCPSGWAAGATMPPGTVIVLGRMAAIVHDLPAPGTRCVVVAGAAEQAGRKVFARSALYAQPNRLLAAATATWISVRP